MIIFTSGLPSLVLSKFIKEKRESQTFLSISLSEAFAMPCWVEWTEQRSHARYDYVVTAEINSAMTIKHINIRRLLPSHPWLNMKFAKFQKAKKERRVYAFQ